MLKGKLVTLMTMLFLLWVANPVPQQANEESRFFPETSQEVRGSFLRYWKEHGGLAQQGYPISSELFEVSPTDSKTYNVQYFERAVFELHPENKPPYNVLLSLIGKLRYQAKYPLGASNQQASTSNPRFFSETSRTLGGKFRQYWETHGGLRQYCYPISDQFMETSEINSKTYLVQYFERAVFELHPENAGTDYEVLLSQLGTYQYESRNQNPNPVTSQLLIKDSIVDLDMISFQEGWAVSVDGVALQFSGGRWNTRANILAGAESLSQVSMASSSDGWFAGSSGAIGRSYLQHYINGEWVPYEDGNIPLFNDIEMVSGTEGWAVGDDGANGVIMHYIDNKWRYENIPLVRRESLSGVSMVSRATGWAIGYGGTVLRYEDGSWRREDTPPGVKLLDIKMLSNKEGWSVGREGTILHFIDGSWKQETNSSASEDLYGVSAPSSSDVWVVGAAGTILHYKDGVWSNYPSPTKDNLYKVEMVSAEEGWAVGGSREYGVILHYLNGTWSLYNLLLASLGLDSSPPFVQAEVYPKN